MYELRGEFLTAYPLLRIDDLDEARYRVTEKFCDHKLDKSSRLDNLAVRHNHVAGEHVSINYLHYGTDVEIDPRMLEDFYLLQVPLSGAAIVHHRGFEIFADQQTATLLNPDRDTRMHWHGDCRKLLLQIDKSFLDQIAQDLLGHPAPGPVRFNPVVDLQTKSGQHVVRILKQAAYMAGAGSLFGRAGRAQDLWAETELVSTLLNHQNSNISHIIHAADHHALPADIKRAVAFIHDNLSETVTLADIAKATRLNGRTLQNGFKRSSGKSPMQVLRDVRLDAARYFLSVKRDPPSVTDAAYQAGFSHLGRFSQAYKMRFGRFPSEDVLN